MRQFAFVVLLAFALGACADTGAPEGADVDPFAALGGEAAEAPPQPGKADGDGAWSAAYDALPADADLHGAVAALFAPDEPVNTIELALIDEVVAARALDTAEYEEGLNPYRIRYAVYNLRNPLITEALIAAEAAGVDVQILIESLQLSASRAYNTMDDLLIERGFEFEKNHRKLDDAGRCTADLIGIRRSGLTHVKTRIFETPESAAVLTGSMNPGDHAVFNDETLVLLRDPVVVAAYARNYDAILTDGAVVNVWDDAAPVNALFTPVDEGPSARAKLFDWLRSEHEQILLMVYAFRDIQADDGQGLVDLLCAKAQAGVTVAVILDRKQSDGVDKDGNSLMPNHDTEDRLRMGGVTVYEAINSATPYTAMHHKVAVLGRTRLRVVADAANWTTGALGKPGEPARYQESQLFIDSTALDGGLTGHRFLGQWMRVLHRHGDQSAGLGEAPTPAELTASLVAHPDWPTAAVRFVAHDTETAWGEQVRVLGSAAALGGWGDSGPGLELFTDEDSYPTWTSEPVELPVGAPFEWKLVTAFDGLDALRWETGANRSTLPLPAFLTADPDVMVEGTWRD